MTRRFGVPIMVAIVVIGSAVAVSAAGLGPPGPGGAKGSPGAPGGPPPGGSARSGPQTGQDSVKGPALSQDAAARSRMHECGHQWSSMKKAGTTGALTWKEFSSTCLVVSR